MEKNYLLLIGILVIGFVGGYLFHSPIIETDHVETNSDSVKLTEAKTYFDSPASQGYTDLTHNSIPTKMSLQGRVTDFNDAEIDDANLGVKISDANSCSSQVFFDYNYFGAIQDGSFNVLLGQNEVLPLNYNKDYYMCLYVNGEQLSGPQVFRGGQGEVHSEQLFDGNATVPLDVNYVKIRNDLNVVGDIQLGCGRIYWDNNNHAINIQVNC
ncbi:MAG: hypothetical protein IPJ89_01580 [Candidatus Iainarchaeum archaeon]|uniref:Uncharacterized protein n=1 Tax=Candidatus Iainarchaeum sp. TaxID=3101447 RepID=A0A7T9I206_9ARCH|nr:MAG: hypothetical protein IPJ89_01580 [Candidatus Diapherotrites archaeon]